MIKDVIRVTGRMTGQTRIILIHIAANAGMCLIGFRIDMTAYTGIILVIARSRMAFCTLIPNTRVSTAVNRKILIVMVKGGRYPTTLTMTTGTIRRKLRRNMVRIFRVVVICLMTAHAGIRCLRVITVVTSCTIIGYDGMGSVEYVIIVVVRHACRCPTGSRRVAGDTVVTEAQGFVVRICSPLKISRVTTYTCRRCIGVIALMTSCAIVCYLGVCPG